MHEGEAFDNQVAAAVVAMAVAAVDGEDGVQWRRWGGRLMAESAAQWTRLRHDKSQLSNHPAQ